MIVNDRHLVASRPAHAPVTIVVPAACGITGPPAVEVVSAVGGVSDDPPHAADRCGNPVETPPRLASWNLHSLGQKAANRAGAGTLLREDAKDRRDRTLNSRIG